MPGRSYLILLREALLTIVPAVALVAGGFYLAWTFVPPPPPKKLVIAAATPGSPYYEAAKSYAAFFAGTGVTLEIKETRGSLDNLAQIRDASNGIDAAFTQGGLVKKPEAAELLSIGRIFYEPVWIFQRVGEPIARLTDLKGKRVLVGPAGSGTEAVALRLLSASGITAESAVLVNAELPTYPDMFAAGTADAGFLVLAPEARTVQRLFASEHARVVSLAQADGYAQRFPFLSRVDLAAGVVDFANGIPTTDTRMLSTTAAVVIRRDLHPALANLLAQALLATHAQARTDSTGETSILSRTGVFPVSDDQEFALSPEALRVYKSGPPFLQRYMPYYWAVLVDRLIVILVPVLGILLPTLRFAPQLYSWRVRRRITYWYKELKKLEAALKPTPESVAHGMAEIDRVEEAVNRIPVPLAFASQLYDLRQHIDVVRRRLSAMNVASAVP